MRLPIRSAANAVLRCAMVLAVLSAPANATIWEHDLRGYVKNTGVGSRPDGEVRSLDVTRGRIKLRWFPAYSLTLAADYDASIAVVSPAISAVDREYLNELSDSSELLDLSWQLLDADRMSAVHTIDRLYAEYYTDVFIVTVGRQRIAWGVSDYFRPLDRFAPFAVAAIDKYERAGIDAVRMSFPQGRLSSLELVYNPRSGFDEQRFGGRTRTTVGEWDIEAVGFANIVEGADKPGKLIGGSLSGPVLGAGVKGEFLFAWDDLVGTTYFHPDDPRFGAIDRATHRIYTSYARATLGASYGFDWRNLVVSGEAYYDGNGDSDPDNYDWGGLVAGDRLTLARYYAAGSVSALATPLVAVSAVAIMNATDGSWLLNPLVTWDVVTNFQIIAGGQIFFGNGIEEYAVQPGALYAILTWHF